MPPKKAARKAPSKHHEPEYEFMGPYIGPIGITVGLPLVCYLVQLGCNKDGCLAVYPKLSLPTLDFNKTIFTWEALGIFLAYFAFQVALHLLIPSALVDVADGVVLPDKSRLKYKLTGWYNFVVTLGLVGYFGFYTRQLDLTWVYDNSLPLLTASVMFSYALAAYLYVSSADAKKLRAKGGDTGNALYDFFIGRELNPRIHLGPLGWIDLKEFCELYPGLIGWVVINLSMAYTQLVRQGRVTNSMVLVNLFQMYYVIDALWNERAILSTMDITTDGFGFMLTFGDLTWVPFIYSIQTRYLVDYPLDLSPAYAAAVVGLKLFGLIVFRGSNSQKDKFRSDPNGPSVRHLKTLQTERGTKLIISGWWGIARHINYTGDWLMGLAWCLPCGIGHVVPYFYAIYFATLLIHRDLRDDHACSLKYGKDWEKYKSIVKYKLIPFVY